MLWAWAVVLYAYLSHDATATANGSTHFDICVAFFCMIITGLIAWEYWKDNILRLIAGTIALTAANNFLDEFLFNPFVMDWNELIFAIIISINFIFTMSKILTNGRSKSRL